MKEKIQEALLKLDTSNENHWTQDGLPRLDTIKILASDPSLTRETVSEAAPGFTPYKRRCGCASGRPCTASRSGSH